MPKTLLKLLLLAGLAVGASGIPGLLGSLSDLKEGLAPQAAVPAGKDENSRELRRELADLGNTVKQLKGLAGPVKTGAAKGLSAEERGILQDAAPKIRFKKNALTKKLGLAGGGAAETSGGPLAAASALSRLRRGSAPEFQSFKDFRGSLLRFYYSHQSSVAYALWVVPAAALVLSLLLLLLKRYTLSMLIGGWVFLAANILLWALSASVVLSTMMTRQNLLAILPRELWLSPVVFLIAAVGMLRLADENYPFWNRTVSALVTPVAASVIAAFWITMASGLKDIVGTALGKART